MSNNGKFMVYTSNEPATNRLRVISRAVSKVANSLELKTEFSSKRKLLSIYVYYRSEAGDEIPIYSDWGKSCTEKDVHRAIRNMMFVLSFHPNHTNLRLARKKMCLFA
jgi:hypothetical protein